MGVIHPIEADFLEPEAHSLMNVTRPVLRPENMKRLVLLVSKPEKLKGTYVEKYLRYGEANTFGLPTTVPKRKTCAQRPVWYDLTNFDRGQILWSKGAQYRHVIVLNANRNVANCRLYDVSMLANGGDVEQLAQVTAAIANSTIVAFTKTYDGRYTGTEGNFELMVSDLNLLQLPDPRHVNAKVCRKLADAFAQLCERDTMPLVEEAFMDCHSPREAKKLAESPVELPRELRMPDRRALDLAVFELLGVASAQKREELCDRLYFETANHFRNIRIVEIQKQEQRTGGGSDRLRVDDLASDIWDALNATEKQSARDWLAKQMNGDCIEINIPEGRPTLHDPADMFSANVVHFRPDSGSPSGTIAVEYPTRAHAEFAAQLAQHNIRGTVTLPQKEPATQSLLANFASRNVTIMERLTELARSRTADESKVDELVALLFHWLIHGK